MIPYKTLMPDFHWAYSENIPPMDNIGNSVRNAQ